MKAEDVFSGFTADEQEAHAREVMDIVERWRKNIEYFWKPSEDQLIALARSYTSDPKFKEKFDRIDPRLADFIGNAVEHWVKCRK